MDDGGDRVIAAAQAAIDEAMKRLKVDPEAGRVRETCVALVEAACLLIAAVTVAGGMTGTEVARMITAAREEATAQLGAMPASDSDAGTVH